MTHTLPLNQLLQNRYLITRVIGQGGFGITYEAKHINLDKRVCIKELFINNISYRKEDLSLTQTTGTFSFSGFLDRFVSEARKTAIFEHPNIVRTNDLFLCNNTAYIVMEFVEGETLKAKIQSKEAFTEQAIISIISQLMDGIEEIHAKGIIHRDIKPENIMITSSGRLVLIDFGTSKDLTNEETLAIGGASTVILTQGYAAPEQYSSLSPKGFYTDIYAMGATLYTLLTGALPISAVDRNMGHELDQLPIDNKFYPLIMKAMSIDKKERFQTVEDFRAALQNTSSKHFSKAPLPIKSDSEEQRCLEIINKLSPFSSQLSKTFQYTDTLFLLLGKTESKYIFRKNGELFISENGLISTGNWKYDKASNAILFDNGKRKILLKQHFVDDKVLALVQDGEPKNIYVFIEEALFPSNNYLDYLNMLYYEKSGTTYIKLTDNKGFLEFSKQNTGELRDVINKEVKMNGEMPADGRYQSEKTGRIYLVKNGILSEIYFPMKISCADGVELIFEARDANVISVGDSAFINGIAANDGRYHCGLMHVIHIKNGIVTKKSMF